MPTNILSVQCFERNRRLMKLVLVILAILGTFQFFEYASAESTFTIDDYFDIKQISELAISSDGEFIAYVATRQSLEENQPVREIFVRSTVTGSKPILVRAIGDEYSFQWIPRSNSLAYLSSDKGVTQVFSMDVHTNSINQHTNNNRGVAAFRFSPDGKDLALLTNAPLTSHENTIRRRLYERITEAEGGILFDTEFNSFTSLMTRQIAGFRAPNMDLWLKREGAKEMQVETPGAVTDMHWSSDGEKLSITFVGRDLTPGSTMLFYTSIGVVDRLSTDVKIVAPALAPSTGRPGVYYRGGEWQAESHILNIRRVTERDAWYHTVDWAALNTADEQSAVLPKLAWAPLSHQYSVKAIPTKDESFLFETVVRGVPGLYAYNNNGLRLAKSEADAMRSAAQFQFSEDLNTAAFVRQTLSQPPEVYVWREGSGSQQITQLNTEVAAKVSYNAREVTWTSNDETVVHGWLLEANNAKFEGPRPLLTFVQGGPGTPMNDEFALYFYAGGGGWPYPFEVLPHHGISVLLLNYRGTKTFGAEFSDPDDLDGEPIDDIVSGIESLVASNAADPSRLAISGHSHGADIGPLTMARSKLFRAASFSEGSSNRVVTYSLMSDWLNKLVHDVQYGSSMYENPEQYLEKSAIFHFDGLSTATLFEAGVESLAIPMMGYPKAAKRAGMPTEYFVYPAGHTIQAPRLQEESATRNLDWFRFWLQDYEDPDPQKAPQYERWRELLRLRDENTARVN